MSSLPKPEFSKSPSNLESTPLMAPKRRRAAPGKYRCKICRNGLSTQKGVQICPPCISQIAAKSTCSICDAVGTVVTEAGYATWACPIHILQSFECGSLLDTLDKISKE